MNPEQLTLPDNVTAIGSHGRFGPSAGLSVSTPLNHGGGGGTSGSMETVDAKIAAAEARTDTKFAELRGDLQKFATKGTVWGAVGSAVAAILGVLLALMAFGGDRFDAGLGQADVRQAQLERDAKQDADVVGMNSKLDALLQKAVEAKPTPAPTGS